MANYNTYTSIGIDTKIKFIQDALHGHLGFSNVDFYGRVQKSLNKDSKTFIPEVHVSKTERKEVYYDDKNAPGGNVFFVEEDDKHTTKDGIVFVAKVKIVFMLNLDQLYPNATNRADTEIQDHCLKLVRKLRVLGITAVEKGLSNVLKGFNIENVKLHDMQPYHTFSINGELKYMLNCKTERVITNNDSQDNNSVDTIPCPLEIRKYYSVLDKFTLLSNNSSVNIRNLNSSQIIDLWLNNVTYGDGIGQSGMAKCEEGFSIGNKVYITAFELTLWPSSLNGYWLADANNELFTYSVIQEGQTRNITSHSAPLRTSTEPINIIAVSPKIIKIINGTITEVITLPMNGFGFIEEEEPCVIPVVTKFPDNQFTNARFFQVVEGISYTEQIIASNNPTSYSVQVPFVPAGTVVVDNTGLMTFNYNLTDQPIENQSIYVNYTANNSCGSDSKTTFFKPCIHNPNVLQAPINVSATELQSNRFYFNANYLAYNGTITNVEVYRNEELVKNYFGDLLNNRLGSISDVMDGTAAISGTTAQFKVRVKNSLGEYSDFSEVITVTLP
jgi:hypothetical protein